MAKGDKKPVVMTEDIDKSVAKKLHASQHASGGSDPITPVAIGAVALDGSTKMTGWLNVAGGVNVNHADARLAINMQNDGTAFIIAHSPLAGAEDAGIWLSPGYGSMPHKLHYRHGGVDYTILHTGNKPSGSYTGNGDATARTIETGGIGNVVEIHSQNGTAIVTHSGAITLQSGLINGIAYSGAHCDGGVITIADTSAFLNASGVTYRYQIL